MRITKDAQSFTAQAKVVFASVGMGMGVMFTAIEADQRFVLEKWLAELRGEPLTELGSAPAPQAPNGNIREQGEPEKNSSSEQNYVLNELIIALMRKRVLTDAEGKALLQKLLQ